jgi:hypothetical protein
MSTRLDGATFLGTAMVELVFIKLIKQSDIPSFTPINKTKDKCIVLYIQPLHFLLARPGRDADHSPPSSAEVENE